MSLQTISEKKGGRVYEWAFDHDAARELRARGLGYSTIADQFGVSDAAVRRVCDAEAKKRMEARSQKWIRENKRPPCRGGCGRLVWMVDQTRTGFCRDCLAERRAAKHVRADSLRCTKCGEWKPDDAFTVVAGRKIRRGRRSNCRQCDTAARGAYRRANAEREREQDRNRKRKRRATVGTFVVLEKIEDGTWRELTTVEAASRMAAVERAAEREGTYAAVVATHLTEMRVQPTTVMKVTVGAVGAPNLVTNGGRPAVADRPELVERIRQMRSDGMSLQAIANKLNEEGIPTARGAEAWRTSSVQVAVGYERPQAEASTNYAQPASAERTGSPADEGER